MTEHFQSGRFQGGRDEPWPSPTESGAAREWHSQRTTYLYAPKEFWRLVAKEEEDAGRYAGSDVGTSMSKHATHALIVKLMLTHAIANSGF